MIIIPPSTLGAIVLREKPSKSDNELTDNFYDLEKDLIQVDKRLFMQNNLCEMVPELTKAAIMLTLQQHPVSPKGHSAKNINS